MDNECIGWILISTSISNVVGMWLGARWELWRQQVTKGADSTKEVSD